MVTDAHYRESVHLQPDSRIKCIKYIKDQKECPNRNWSSEKENQDTNQTYNNLAKELKDEKTTTTELHF